MICIICACVLSASLAPVPPKSKPSFEAVLSVDKTRPPFDEKYFRLEIRNSSDKDLEMLSSLPFGPLTFLDVEVRNGKDERISKERYWWSIASPFSSRMPVGVIPAGKSLDLNVKVFQTVEQNDVATGKYKCRIQFRYEGIDILSNSVTVELTDKQIANQK